VQRFGHDAGPFWTAAILYAGASFAAFPRRRAGREARLRASDATRLAAIAVFGAFLAPVALAWGLRRASGVGAALMLNLEAGLTVALGRLLYGEHLGRRVIIAATLIAAGSALLVLDHEGATSGGAVGLAAVALATLGWAFDNALARPLADRDPGAVVFVKGALGGALSVAIALVTREGLPNVWHSAAIFACGAVGFGLSLRLYLLAQRRLGTARTASVFGVAPFVGALVAVAMGQAWSVALVGAAAIMATGVLLHATERHEHLHHHDHIEHDHAHRHDDGHHTHLHEPMPAGEHSHAHTHEHTAHSHAHSEDLHHRHHAGRERGDL
jgi:drug/metabolite transporter (DMT)-like permease